MLTTQPLLVPRLRKSCAIPALTLWALLGLLRGSLYLFYGFVIKWYTSVLDYVDDVNIFGGSVSTIKKNIESLVVSSKQTGIEVNADKTKHMVKSRDQNAGRSPNIKIYSSSFERVEEFKYHKRVINEDIAS
jgi:hypothetical protein